ncbi:hypothetical protein [Streptomyces decoyicus]|nr:hypothetical protein [Streptomyces decoyicus]QZY16859.1 hypothetical protein K7C20_17710 [Streptomyces decoyicus]
MLARTRRTVLARTRRTVLAWPSVTAVPRPPGRAAATLVPIALRGTRTTA